MHMPLAALLVVIWAPFAAARELQAAPKLLTPLAVTELPPKPAVCTPAAPCPSIPPDAVAVSWLGYITVSKSVLRTGDLVTVTFHSTAGPDDYPRWAGLYGRCMTTGPVEHWASLGSSIGDCSPPAKSCTYKVRPSEDTLEFCQNTWIIIDVEIINRIGYAHSQEVVTFVDKGVATIEGYTRDSDDRPLAGVTVTANSTASPGKSYTAISSSLGYYILLVPPGRYVVSAAGGPFGSYCKNVPAAAALTDAGTAFKVDNEVQPAGNPPGKCVPPQYAPRAAPTPYLRGGANSTADFVLNDGVRLEVMADKAIALATGFDVVTFKIKTTEFGQPIGKVTVSVRPHAYADNRLLGTIFGVRVQVCDPNQSAEKQLIWPSGTPWDPSVNFPDVITSDAGEAEVKMYVGTIPGEIAISFWSRDPDGSLSVRKGVHSYEPHVITVAAPEPATLPAKLEDWEYNFLVHVGGRLQEAGLTGQLPTDFDNPDQIERFAVALGQLAVNKAEAAGMAYAPVAIGDGSRVALIAYPYDRALKYTAYTYSEGPMVVKFQNLFVVGLNDTRADTTFFLSGACFVGRSTGQASLHDLLLGEGSLRLQRMPRLAQFFERDEVAEWNMRAIPGHHTIRHYKEDFRFHGFPYLHCGNPLW